MNFLAKRFWNIKGKNPSDWNDAAQSYVLKEVMKEGVKHYFLGKLNKLLQHEGKKDSTSHLLVANPQQWYTMFPESEQLNNLSPEILQSLYNKSHPVIDVNSSHLKKIRQKGFTISIRREKPVPS